MQNGKSIGLSALALAISAVATQAQAATITKANNTAALNDPSSWVGGVAPGSGDIAQWDSTIPKGGNTTVLGTDASWQGVKITNPSGLIVVNAGNTLTLGSSGIDVSSSTQELRFYAAINLGTSQTWNTGAKPLPTGDVNLGANILTIDGGGGDGLVTFGNLLGAEGTLRILSGSIAFKNVSTHSFGTLTVDGGTVGIGGNGVRVTTGATSISAGRIELGSRGNFITESLSLSGGQLYCNTVASQANTITTINAGGLTITQTASGAYTPISVYNVDAASGNIRQQVINLNGDLTFTGDAGNTNSTTIGLTNDLTGTTGDGAIVINAARTFNVGDGGADVDLVNDVRITGTATGALIKTGAGTLALNGVNTYTGGTTISAGRLLINNTTAGNVAVNGGILGGKGSIAGTVTVADNATLAPGTSAGTLTVGALTLNADSNLAFELGSLAGPNDLVQVNGNLILDGKLDVSALAGFGEGTYTLMTYTGTLTDNGLSVASMPGGTSGTIEAGGGVVNLVVVVPEPAGLALLGVAAAGMLARRRRVA